jgi:hypothetical protein
MFEKVDQPKIVLIRDRYCGPFSSTKGFLVGGSSIEDPIKLDNPNYSRRMSGSRRSYNFTLTSFRILRFKSAQYR